MQAQYVPLDDHWFPPPPYCPYPKYPVDMILIDDKVAPSTAGCDLRNGGDTEPPPPAYDDIAHIRSDDRQPLASYSGQASIASSSSVYQAVDLQSSPPKNPGPSRLSHSQSHHNLYAPNELYQPNHDPRSAPHSASYNGNQPSHWSVSRSPQASSSSASAYSMSRYAPGPRNMLAMRRVIIPGESVAVLLDPPPQSFHCSPSPAAPYPPFETTALMGISGNLSSAFPLVAPPSTAIPHPFATHDVSEIDWTTFVRDVKTASSLSSSGSLMAGVAPITTRLPVLGLFVRVGIELGWKDRQTGSAAELIEYWNYHFFHPRRLHVVLARGSMSFSGPDIPPPDELGVSTNNNPRQSQDPKTSNVTGDYTDLKQVKNMIKKELKAAGKELKAAEKERKEQRKVDLQNASDQRWRLVVAYHP